MLAQAYLALRVIEVGWDGDNCALDLAALAHKGLRNVAHLGQDHAADLLRRESFLLALERHCASTAHLSTCCENEGASAYRCT